MDEDWEKKRKILLTEKLPQIYDYFKVGKLFWSKQKISFYESSSTKAFLKTLRGVKDPISTDLSSIQTIEISEPKSFLLLRVKVLESEFEIEDNDAFEIELSSLKKHNFVRVYLEFLIDSQIGIKIVRLYSDLEHAFPSAREKILNSKDGSIEFHLYDGLDKEVLGNILESKTQGQLI